MQARASDLTRGPVPDLMDLETKLGKFTGTTRYYRHWLGLLYTDGVQYLAEEAGAYWLVDVVASYQPQVRDVPFQLWQLAVGNDRSAEVTMVADVGQPALVQQHVPYTDFPLPNIQLYCIDQVLLLPSEY